MVIFVILILPVHEHGRYFHLLISSLIYSFEILKFLSFKTFTCRIRVTLRCVLFCFLRLFWKVLCPWFLSQFFMCICKSNWFFCLFVLILYLAALLKVFHVLQKFPGRLLWVFYYKTISSANKDIWLLPSLFVFPWSSSIVYCSG